VAAEQVVAHGHPRARFDASDGAARLDDLAGDLVAHDPRRVDVLVAVVEDLDVGAAGGAVAHPELDLVRPALGLGGVLDADVLRRVEAHDLHQWVPL
jgi:hypothetical protein